MNYPAVVHKDPDSDYGVTVPDLPGCFSAGATMDEALAMAKEAIELHLEGLIDEGLKIPAPTSIEQHRRNPQYRGGAWAIVTVNASQLRINAKRINVTMPERILDAVDRFAKKYGRTRSGLLLEAVTDYLSQHGGQAPVSRKKRKQSLKPRQR